MNNISSRERLSFYIYADRMMNRGYFRVPFRQKLVNIFCPDYIMLFLNAMRRVQFYSHRGDFAILQQDEIF